MNVKLKTLLILFMTIISFACSKTVRSHHSPYDDTTPCYQISNIDSIGGVYVIYAFLGEKKIKIISQKTGPIVKPLPLDNIRTKIHVGKCYNLILSSLRENYIVNGKNVFPLNYMDIEFNVGGGTSMKMDEAYNDFYFPSNLDGLYLIESKGKKDI